MSKLKPLNNTDTNDKTIKLTYQTLNCLCTISFKLPVKSKKVIDGAIMELQIWLNGLLKNG